MTRASHSLQATDRLPRFESVEPWIVSKETRYRKTGKTGYLTGYDVKGLLRRSYLHRKELQTTSGRT